MNSYIRRGLRYIYFKGCLHYKPLTMVRLGSEYGGWNVPKNYLSPQSVCYLAGAGLDISFDLEIAASFGSEVHIFDPTPRAYDHFKELEHHVAAGESMRYKEGRYSISKEAFSRISFHKIGLWSSNAVVKFYEPRNKEHVSHSVVNLQKTDSYFDAQVLSVKLLMEQLGHTQLDLLKLDIEGAEYEVLKKMVEDRVFPKVLCIEFDEVHTPLNLGFVGRIRKQLKALKEVGYKIVSVDEAYNVTLLFEPKG